MINIKTAAALAFAFVGLGLGSYVDYQDTLRMTMFRDKSALYGRVLKEGEQPSWPTTYF